MIDGCAVVQAIPATEVKRKPVPKYITPPTSADEDEDVELQPDPIWDRYFRLRPGSDAALRASAELRSYYWGQPCAK